jgi:hypothetical protein
MALFTDLLPYIVPECAGVTDTMATREAVNAAIEFFRQTNAWTADLDPVTVVATVARYDLDAPTDTVVNEILEARYNGTLLPAKTKDDLNAQRTDWRAETGRPVVHLRPSLSQVQLVPTPDVNSAGAGLLFLNVSLRPQPAAVTLDDDMFTQYYLPLAYGALARLQAMPGRDWTDPVYAQANAQRFQAAILDTRAFITRGMGHGESRVLIKPFA